MAAKKSGSRKKRKANRATYYRFGVVIKVLAVICCVCVIGAFIYFAGRKIVRSVQADPGFQVDPVQIELKLPKGVSGAIKKEITYELSYLREASLFDPNLPVFVAAALKNCPWVLRVNRVQRTFPNMLRLELEFRKPAGIVDLSGQLYLVDATGYWLPSAYFEWPGKPRPPLIVGANLKKWPPKGRKWRNPAVEAGALLTQFLMRHREELVGVCIEKIDVTNFGKRKQTGKSCLVLVTDRGVRINWGCSPVCSRIPGLCNPAGELADEQKLSNLKRVLRIRPALAGCEMVDVRFRRPVYK